MLRSLAVLGVLIFAGGVSADEVKGKVKKVDAEKGIIVVVQGDKDHEFKIGEDTKILDNKGKALAGGFKASAFKAKNLSVAVTCEKKGDKEVVVSIKLLSAPKDKD